MDALSTASLQEFEFGPYRVEVLVPDPNEMRAQWEENRIPAGEFPYWSRIWPSAKALCSWLSANSELFRRKRILELGAGLGLPSLLCAREAGSVLCTDRSPEAVRFAAASAERSGLSSMRCAVLDWMTYPQPIPCDLLLLSDVNYAPEYGAALKALIWTYRQRHATILLATPQRPAGRAFAMDILPWVEASMDMEIQDSTGNVVVTLFRIGPCRGGDSLPRA